MKIAVVGTGYVGLVTGAGFSDFGFVVLCVVFVASRIGKLRAGEVPFYEPGLHDLIRRNTTLGRLHFTTSTSEAVANAAIVFIAVGSLLCVVGCVVFFFVFVVVCFFGVL